MSVAEILAHKGGQVVSVDGDATLHEAAQILDERHIGAVVILRADGLPEGVLSERDITAAVARRGPHALAMRVADCMSRNVATCRPGDSLDMLMERMTDRRIRHLPVAEAGRLLGIVSIGDVVKQKIADTEAEAAAMKTYIASA